MIYTIWLMPSHLTLLPLLEQKNHRTHIFPKQLANIFRQNQILVADLENQLAAVARFHWTGRYSDCWGEILYQQIPPRVI